MNEFIEKETCFNCSHWDENDFGESVCLLTGEPSQNHVCEKYKCIFDMGSGEENE